MRFTVGSPAPFGEHRSHHQLFLIVDAGDASGFLARLGQRRQKHASQDRNDGDDYKQFNQCEASGLLRTG